MNINNRTETRPPDHAVEVVSDAGELRLRLVCHAPVGSPCRRRPPEGDDREYWPDDDPDLVDAECWAVEWVSEVGWDDAISADGPEVWTSIPVGISYDEGVEVWPEQAAEDRATALIAAGFVKPSTVEFFAHYEDGTRFGPSELDLRKVNPTLFQSPVKSVFVRHVTAWQPVEEGESE